MKQDRKKASDLPNPVVMARCRWCDRNDRPIEAMAIYSYKHSYGGFTGVCKECMDDPTAEARYHYRHDNVDNVRLNNDCNGKIAITTANDPMPDLKEVLHADDVAAATIPDSSKA
jgi:hypothetical protein